MGTDLGRSRPVRVRAENVWHRFADFVALRGVSIEIPAGQFVTLLGPSGSGKTTLLRIISGLLRPQSGRIFIGDRDVTRLPADKREIGFVFQNYALFPHLTVFENVAFALRLRRVPAEEIGRRVHAALEKVFLEGLDARYPSQLSGGQQQRVALARAIAFDPTLLLMDEPLGSLDKRLRQQLQIELRRLQRAVGITTVYVTHDQEEAFSMSDQIAVMGSGKLHQLASPEQIYRQPADTFVAHFVGDLNYFEGRYSPVSDGGGVVETERGLSIRVRREARDAPGALVGCGIRPEKLRIDADHAPYDNQFSAKVRMLTFRGSHYWADLLLPSGDGLIAMLPETSHIGEGDEVSVGWNADEVRVFPASERARGPWLAKRAPDHEATKTEES
ncbi:MAG TPA: ABC transporter ATP-binding protein [Stellaceae bacterium]|nr:ABC transporter ATP-binding protein [Stellaceae bacterium]